MPGQQPRRFSLLRYARSQGSMNFQRVLGRMGGGLVFLAAALLATLYASQKTFRVYPSLEPYDDVSLPPDYQEKTEWIFARLMYPEHPNALFSRRYRFGGSMDWREGGTSWTQDYPRADRHFSLALRRLTRISARSVEQPVNLDDDDDVYDFPWLCAGEMGDWKLTASQAKKLRDYLLRGGFLMLDDFWGAEEWNGFAGEIKRVLPDRAWSELTTDHPLFNCVYDLRGPMSRLQVPTIQFWNQDYDPKDPQSQLQTIFRGEGSKEMHVRALLDDHQRMMVLAIHNSDVSDGWEREGENELYFRRYSEQIAYPLGINVIFYLMTH